MNEQKQLELKKLVERVVRPLVATRERKRLMREELLAHLTIVFEDEFSKLADEPQAMETTSRRFGDTGQLTAELQASVGLRERAGYLFQKFGQPSWQPGDTPARLAARQLLTLAVAFFLMLPIMPVGEWLRGGRAFGAAIGMGIALTVIMTALTAYMLIVPTHFGRTLFGAARERSIAHLVAFALVSVAILLAMPLAILFGATRDIAQSLAASQNAFWFALLMGPPLFFIIGRLAYQEFAYEREWASLELDE